VLISLYRFHRKRTPHWVTVTGFDERYMYVNDPWVNKAAGRTATDCINLPIPRSEFEGMARWGRSGERAVLFVSTGQDASLGKKPGKNQDKSRRN
jgi:predicted double-glycine peptidase